MLSLQDVLDKNINVPTPRGKFTDEDKKQIFATNRGWVKIREDGRSELLFVIRNLDLKIKDLIKSNRIPLNDEQKIITTNNISEVQNTDNVFFDYIELENSIESKTLKKGNLIRINLVWSDQVNIKANDSLKTYIKVYTDKDRLLGNAYYRERVNEKTLMFVYKIGKEKINGIKINPIILDGRIKDQNGNIINNPDKLYVFENVVANIL